MGEKIDKLVALAMGKAYIPPHESATGAGHPYFVKGYFRSFERAAFQDQLRGYAKGPSAPQTPPAEGTMLKDYVPNPKQAADQVQVLDQRPDGYPKVHIDDAALNNVIKATGIKVTPDLQIQVRLRPQNMDGSNQGLTEQTGKNRFRVTVYMAKKDKYEDRHLYVMNNSLLHEMRHVRQNQDDPQMGQKYGGFNMMPGYGYGKNPYEIEARQFGRQAELPDMMAKKPITVEGLSAQGKKLWGIMPEGVDAEKGDVPDPPELGMADVNPQFNPGPSADSPSINMPGMGIAGPVEPPPGLEPAPVMEATPENIEKLKASPLGARLTIEGQEHTAAKIIGVKDGNLEYESKSGKKWSIPLDDIESIQERTPAAQGGGGGLLEALMGLLGGGAGMQGQPVIHYNAPGAVEPGPESKLETGSLHEVLGLPPENLSDTELTAAIAAVEATNPVEGSFRDQWLTKAKIEQAQRKRTQV